MKTKLIIGVVVLFAIPLVLLLIAHIIKRSDPNGIPIGINQVQVSSSLSILQTIPSDEASNVSIFSPIQVVFSRALTNEEQKNITLQTDPEIMGGSTEMVTGTTLAFKYSQPLKVNTQYKVTITYNDKKYYFTFITPTAENLSPSDINLEQSEGDHNFGQKLEQNANSFPWKDQLPLQTDQYFVYFDTDKKMFIAKLYPPANPTSAIDGEVAAMKSEITQKLTAINPDTSNYKIDWQVIPAL